MYKLGLDVGSTTLKAVLLSDQDEILYQSYERHRSLVREMSLAKIKELKPHLEGHDIQLAISGSAGLGLAEIGDFPFVQEVFATAGAVRRYDPDSDVVIELGGEDAKILFLKGSLEERMNSTCAGGTGAFIDQMAALLNLDLKKMDELSLKHTQLYPIASRCGVFAKSDIQPLVNQGADKANIAASIFQAVVDQTIIGLAQGRKIEGKILFLGGPLSFLKGLQQRFVETLKIDAEHAVFPDTAPYYVALGAAVYAMDNTEIYTYDQLIEKFEKIAATRIKNHGLKPLFKDNGEYSEFKHRHQQSDIPSQDIHTYQGDAYIGIDAGSTTTKLIMIDEKDRLLYSSYTNNLGNPIDVVKAELANIYKQIGNRIKLRGCAVTGYGEDLIKSAFHGDCGVVETVAHYTAARHFNPDVDFIIDIGGQDMKCFRIKDHTIDDMVLNEACSSGCGSFIETFARSLGYDIEEFARLGLTSKEPVDLGSRCTVFMNSSVKEAQKNGASVADISAGLAMSIVKNALYKVIRARSVEDIGKQIVVQGGTFLNDTILRSFEIELGRNVIRPSIAGLMGAYGAALYVKTKQLTHSTLISKEDLTTFAHTSKAVNCGGCTNRCNLTINTFRDGSRHIAGNKCEKPLGMKQTSDNPDLYAYKYQKLMRYESKPGSRGRIGIPMVLNMYENLPFWHTFFTELGFEVVLSGRSTKQMYAKGSQSISSDTVCFPAKLVHGHIQQLIDEQIPVIFYPCMTYNFDEGISDNQFNCPVVAYYPEVIAANMELDEQLFLYPYLSLHQPARFYEKMQAFLKRFGCDISIKEIKRCGERAYHAYHAYKKEVLDAGQKAIQYAHDHNKKMILLAGRPYHIDPLINHGIHKLLTGLDFVVLSEDSVPAIKPYEKINVLNQWTYHARMYNAARYVCEQPDMEVIQLVSFGCGIDAITSDEMKDILRNHGKLYTQIKIDEVDNLGAIRIRVRSLLAAMEERK